MGISGYVVLGIATVFFVYLIPQLIRSRQEVVDSRAEDRFSADLRILATAGTATPATRLMPDHGAPRAYLHDPRLRTEVSAMNRPPALVSRHDQARSVGSAGAPTIGPDTQASPARAAARAEAARRRREAARRRLALTLTMLAMTVGAWVAVGLGVTVPLVATIPSAILALVLLLGRRAAIAGRRAEQADRGNVQRPAIRTAPAPTPEPARALPSRSVPEPSRAALEEGASAVADASAPARTEAPARDAVTELIPRLNPRPNPRLDPRLNAGTPDRESGSSLRWSGEPTSPTQRRDFAPVAAARPGSSEPVGTSWTPVPVPAPTYTLKPTAPRVDAPPLVLGGTDDTHGARAASTADRPAADVAPEAGPNPDTEVVARSLDLDAVLSRRRAAGE